MKNVETVSSRARMHAERICGTREYSYDGTQVGEICPQRASISPERMFAIERHQEEVPHLRRHTDKEYAKRLGTAPNRVVLFNLMKTIAIIGEGIKDYEFQCK